MFDIREGVLVRLQVKSKTNPSYTHVYQVTETNGDKCNLTCVSGGSRGVLNVSTDDVFMVLPKMALGDMLNLWDSLEDSDCNIRNFNTIFHHCTLKNLNKSLGIPVTGGTRVNFIERISSRLHLLEIDGNKVIHEFGDTSLLFDSVG